MPTNRKLRTALLLQMGVTPQRLSQKVARIKKLHGPMSTEDGTYLVAHHEGLDLSKYLPRGDVDRIRGMLPANGGAPQMAAQRKPKPRATVGRTVRIGNDADASDPLLSPTVVTDAKEMAQIYARLYVFENSIRNVIQRILQAGHGKEWWSKCAPEFVQNQVRSRRDSEAKKPWHGKRGAHDIHYADFSDLRRIIEKNWGSFSWLFPDQPWIVHKLSELEHPRNVVAHCNPLNKQDRDRISLYYRDWNKLLGAKRIEMP